MRNRLCNHTLEKKRFRIFTYLTLCLGGVFVCLFCPSSAFAYIDPGSSSLLLQLLLSGVAGFLILFKVYWKSLTAIFGRFSKRADLDSKD
jgi:hypothetical protein